jgi:hypothetical protein
MANPRSISYSQPSSDTRWSPIYSLIYLSLSLAAVYYMRILPSLPSFTTSSPLSDQIETIITSRRFPPPHQHIRLETEYTGISSVDKGLVYLVVAFTPAVMGFDRGFWVLLVHFLISFAAVVGVWGVEARRRGNKEGGWARAVRL